MQISEELRSEATVLDRGARGGEPPLAPRANYPLPLLHHHHYHHHRHHDHNYHDDYNDLINDNNDHNDHNDHNNHLNDNIAQANLVIIYIYYIISSFTPCLHHLLAHGLMVMIN